MIKGFLITILVLMQIEIPFFSGLFTIFATVNNEPIQFEIDFYNELADKIVFEKEGYTYHGLAERTLNFHFRENDITSILFAIIMNSMTRTEYDIWLHGYITLENELVGFWSGYKEDYLWQPKTNWLREIYLICSKIKMF